jgi:hypothetical protein
MDTQQLIILATTILTPLCALGTLYVNKKYEGPKSMVEQNNEMLSNLDHTMNNRPETLRSEIDVIKEDTNDLHSKLDVIGSDLVEIKGAIGQLLNVSSPHPTIAPTEQEGI